jgi:hypothetical protein
MALVYIPQVGLVWRAQRTPDCGDATHGCGSWCEMSCRSGYNATWREQGSPVIAANAPAGLVAGLPKRAAQVRILPRAPKPEP